MIRALALIGLVAVVACKEEDETARGYGAGDTVWQLAEINGTAFEANATMTFPEEGRIAGNAPCNSYAGEMSVPYPWFEAKALAVTRKACRDVMQAEQTFFDTLGRMTLIEVAEDTLMLTNDDNTERMVFTSG